MSDLSLISRISSTSRHAASWVLSPEILPFSIAALCVGAQVLFNVWNGLTPVYLPEFIGATLGISLLAIAPAFFFRGYLRLGYLIVVTLLFSMIVLSQQLFYAYAEGFLQVSALRYAHQALDERATIYTLLSPSLLFLLSPFFLAVAACFLRSTGNRRQSDGRTKRISALSATTLLLIILLSYGMLFIRGTFDIHKIAHPYTTLRDMNNFLFSPEDLVKKIGIVTYTIRDGIGYAFRHTQVPEEEVLFATSWVEKKETPEPAMGYGIARGKNVILLQVESLERVVIGAHVEGKEVTPHLNKLAREGLFFPNYYAQVGPGNTADAEFVTLNSLYPLSNTVAFIDYSRNTYVALPQLLRKRGYFTAVFHDDAPTFWNRSNIYPGLGYALINSEGSFATDTEQIFEHLGDRPFLKQVAGQMTDLPKPFFATVITLSSHTPFLIPEEFRSLSVSEASGLSERQQRYLESIRYADDAIGGFLAELEHSGILEDSILVIYGDHGSFTKIEEAIGGRTSEAIGELAVHHVPLLVVLPGQALRGTFLTPGSHLDLYPTLGNLLGIETPAQVIGKDLLNTHSPVVTHRDPDSQAITTIMTKEKAYLAGSDALFVHGECLTLPGRRSVPIEECRMLYDEELATTRVSDILVKGDLLPLLGRTMTTSSGER